jgi:NADH:ubiquinone oxidoreductase subunit 6 (subunit J)
MLLEIPSAELRAYYRGYSLLGLFALIGVLMSQFLFSGGYSVNGLPGTHIASFTSTMESISNIGVAFYIRYADILILNSLVLTIALFGALVLGSPQIERS